MDKFVNYGGVNLKVKDNGDGTWSAQAVLDGTDATGVTQESGGTGSRGWLSSIYNVMKGIQTTINAFIAGNTVNEVKRYTLVANTDTLFTFSGVCKRFDILNVGPGDAYYEVDGVASVNGTTSTLLPAETGYGISMQGTTIHVISTGTPIVQIVGVR